MFWSRLPSTLWGLCCLMVAVCPVMASEPSAPPSQDDGFIRESLIAVFPTVNLSAKLAPMDELRALVRETLDLHGLHRVERPVLELFMERNRVRYTGGVSSRLATALADYTWAEAVLVTSLHSYDEFDPPTFAMSARLVSTEDLPRILWMREISLTGDQKPGFLATSLVRDVEILRDRVIQELFDSLIEFLNEGPPEGVPPLKAQNRFRPKRFYRTPERAEAASARFKIAVLPFINDSPRRAADEVLMEQFVFRFWDTQRVEVLEPGVVRATLLKNRLIRDEGLTMTQIYVLSAELNVDLIVSGDVADYVETAGFGGIPLISFTSRAIDARRGIVSWTAISNNRGSDGEGLFASGSIRGGHALASQMIRAVVATALDPRARRKNSISNATAADR